MPVSGEGPLNTKIEHQNEPKRQPHFPGRLGWFGVQLDSLGIKMWSYCLMSARVHHLVRCLTLIPTHPSPTRTLKFAEPGGKKLIQGKREHSTQWDPEEIVPNELSFRGKPKRPTRKSF